MMRVALCLASQHDGRLVALALIICLVGSASTVELFSRIGRASGATRLGWTVLTSVAAGTMVWCTHFVAMLAYRATAPIILDPTLTLLSLVVAVMLTASGLAVATASTRRWAVLVGGALVGVAISAMHYTGMEAYRVQGFVRWDARYVAASVLVAMALSALAFDVLRLKGPLPRRVLGAMLLGIAVAGLHFTGMAAMTVVPLAAAGAGHGLSRATLEIMAVATAFGGLLVIGCAAVSALIDSHTQSETYQRLRRMALHDSLTDLPNRMSFRQTFHDQLSNLAGAHRLAVVMLDLSRFKDINDTYGHQAGDQLLIALSERCSQVLAADETFARLGGDEFAALKSFQDRSELEAFLGRITRALEPPFLFERFTTHASANIGVAIAPEDGIDPDTLIANADLAMYRAKSSRSSVPSYYQSAMDEAARHRCELGNQLRSAIETQQFSVAYQVQVSLWSGQVSGYEALARWTHPVDGAISPGVFIPLAEELGEISRLGDWILDRACREAAAWADPLTVAVNLSPIQLSDPLLVDKVRDTLSQSGLAPHRLELELTESALMKDRERALAKLRQIKLLGVNIALDDFGAGYSSLHVLRCFPFDRIKLDASFVSEVEHSDQSLAILRSVASLGRTLGVPVLAEGVETRAQLAIVAREGCDDAQGFLLGKPSARLADPDAIASVFDGVLTRGRAMAA